MIQVQPYLKSSSRESGFTLLELLLVIGIAAVLFLGITQIAGSWADNEISEGAGQQLQRISTVTQNYVEANWSALRTQPTADALAAGGDWAGLTDALNQEGLLTNGDLRTALNAPLKIAFASTGTGANTIYRTTIYATQNLPYKRVVNAARHAGNSGGMITFFPDGTMAFGAFGQWRVPTISLLPGGAAPCVPDEGNACLIAMISSNQQTLCGPFLYRTDMTGICDNANTMTTDLQMGTNNIINAGNLQATKITATDSATLGATTVAGTATFNGATTAANGMTVNGNTTVSGDAQFGDNVTVNSGTVNATTISANTVDSPRIDSNEVHAQNLQVNNGDLAVDNNISINGKVTVQPGGEVVAGSVSAGAINAGAGDVVVGTLDVQNTMNISGQINMPAGSTIAVDKMVADKCVEISKGGGAYNKYGNCP